MIHVLTENGSRRGTPSSLERQYTMYHGHDDQYGDYYSQQEPMDQNGQTKQTSRYPTDSSYLPSTYQQQNMYNAQKNSVYDEYSDQYGYTNFIRIYELIPKHLRGLLKKRLFWYFSDYGSAGTICNDYSRTTTEGSALNDQSYPKDTT